MRRGVNVVVVALVASTVAACGGGSNSTSSHDVSSPAAAVKTYQSAIANGDGPGACSVLSPAVQKQALSAASGAGVRASNCTSLFSQIAKRLSPTQRARLRNTKVSSVVIHGDTATVQVSGGSQAKLTKSGGKWLISGGLAGSG